MTAMAIAREFNSMYRDRKGTDIDELKLHKLLYLAQRESLIRRKKPLFKEECLAWKYGPVILEVRKACQEGDIFTKPQPCERIPKDQREVIDFVFETYADRSSWSLSALTHEEVSWNHARMLPDTGGGHRVMSIYDIGCDARRVALKRETLKRLGLWHG